MPGPAKGYISKGDPRRKKWEELQSTSAGGGYYTQGVIPDVAPVIGPGGTASAPSRSVAGPPAPSAVEVLKSVRAKREKKDTKPSKKEERARSAVFGVAEVGKEIADLRKGMKETGSVRDALRKDQKKETNRAINKVARQYLDDIPTRNSTDKANLLAAFGSQRDRDLLVAGLSREEWKRGDDAVTTGVTNPWRGVPQKAPIRKQRKVVRKLASGKASAQPLLPSEKQAELDKANMWEEMIGLGMTPTDIALMVPGIGTAGKLIKGGKKALDAVEAGNAGRRFVVGSAGLPEEQAFNTVKRLRQAAKATKTGKRIGKVRAMSRSKPVRTAKGAAAAGAVGAAVTNPDKALPILEGTGQAIVESPKDVAAATGRGIIGGLAGIPLVAGNTALTGKRALETLTGSEQDPDKRSAGYILKPVETMASEQIAEIKDMAEVYSSGDAERIKEATEDDYGVLPALSAAALLRPGLKVPARAAGRAASELPGFDKLAEYKQGRHDKSQLKTATGRINAEENIRGNAMTKEFIKNRQKFNAAPGGRKVRSKLEEWNRTQEKAAPGNAKPKPVTVEDLAVYAQSKGLPKEFTVKDLRAIQESIDPASPEAKTISVLMKVPELHNMRSRPGKLFAAMRNDLLEANTILDPLDTSSNARKLETMATGEQLTDGKWVDRPEVAIEKLREGEQVKLAGMKKEISALNRKRRSAKGLTKQEMVKLKELERAEDARLRTEMRATAATETERQALAGQTLDSETRLAQIPAERKAINAERRQLITRMSDAPPARRKEIRARLKELDAEGSKLSKLEGEARTNRVRLRNAEKEVRAARGKPDPRLNPLREKVARMMDADQERNRELANAIERTRAFSAEIRNALTPEELAEARASIPGSETKLSRENVADTLDSIREEMATLHESLAGATRGDRRAIGVRIRNLENREAVARTLLDEADLDNAVDLDAAAIRAAISVKKTAKRDAREAATMTRLQQEFDQKYQEYLDLGLTEASYLWQKEVNNNLLDKGSPGYERVLGSPAMKMRTGGMARKGEVDRSFNAWIDTVDRNNTVLKNKNLTHFIVANHVFTEDRGAGPQYEWTETDAQRLVNEGRIDTDKYAMLDTRLLTDPDKFGSVISLKKDGLKKGLETLSDEITQEERLAQKLAAEGEGKRYTFVEIPALERLIEQEARVAPNKVRQVMESIPSRLVLGTSLSWLASQPIAEMLILFADHPAGMWKAMATHRKMVKDPEAFRSLQAVAGNTLGTDPAIRNASDLQQLTSKGVKLLNQTPMGKLVRETAKMETLGRIDRAKGAWIREVGVLAELDRELSTMRRTAKAVVGQLDDIEKVADRLKTMSRAEQLKWLNGRDGQAAGLRIARNIDAALGNWADMTKAEQAISGIVFFYPFVRFSLNWVFRTFPKRHPVRYAILNTMGMANAENLEEEFGKPNWASEWAQVPIYGGDNGEITSVIPLNRFLPGGNALVEAGMGEDGSLAWNLSKAINPVYNTVMRAAMGRDSFGNPIEGTGFGNGLPTNKDTAAIWLDAMMRLPAPAREVMRLKGIDPLKAMVDGEKWADPDRAKIDVGDDPNKLRDFWRRNVAPGTPFPAHLIREERDVAEGYEDLEKASKTGADPYSKLAVKGEEILKKEGELESWMNPDRTPAEKKAVKQYLKEQGAKAQGRLDKEAAQRRIFEVYQGAGLTMAKDSAVLRDVKEARQKKRKELVDDAPDWVKGAARKRYNKPEGDSPDWIIKDKKGKKLAGGPAWQLLGASIPFGKATPDDLEETIRVSDKIPAATRNAPRKVKVKLANKILDAKEKLMASETGVKGNDIPAKMAKALIPLGFNRMGASGVIGNAFAESTFNPEAVEPGTDNGGLLGFTAGEKSMASLRAFADENGMKPEDVETQMKFANTTISDDLKNRMNNAASPEEAASLFMTEWERPGIPREDVRHQGAREAFEGVFTSGKKDPKAKAKFMRLVQRGKMMGIYEEPKGSDAPVKFVDKDSFNQSDPAVIAGLKEVAPEVKTFAKAIARATGQTKVELLSGKRVRGGLTTSGKVSEHGTGNALDLTAYMEDHPNGNAETQKRGDEMAKAAIMLTGGSKKDAEAYIANGRGIYNYTAPNGTNGQIIWGTNDPALGGDHTDHVHVSANGPIPKEWRPPKRSGRGAQQKNGKLAGKYEGSKHLVREIIGKPVTGDKVGEVGNLGSIETGHDADGDHNRPDGYAQDLNSMPGYDSDEHELPFNQESMDTITANLRKMGADVPDMPYINNSGWTGQVGAYEVYIEGGISNHIHVGAHYTGGADRTPTMGGQSIMDQVKAQRAPKSTGPTSTATTSSGSTGSTGGGAPPAGQQGKQTSKQQTLKDYRKGMFGGIPAMGKGETITTPSAAETVSAANPGESGPPTVESAATIIANLPQIKRKKRTLA